jgi:hypothetical protein
VYGERISYVPARDLDEARLHVLNVRAWAIRAWLQVSNDLGRTWTDCADDGSALPSGHAGKVTVAGER